MKLDLTRLDRSWWARPALLLALVLPLLLSGLRTGDCLFHMEVRALASSQETWLRQQTDPQAWRVPSWNGEPRVNKPPLVVWLNMLLWADLPPDTPVDALLYRARLAGVAMGLLALLATAWAGATLGGTRFGWAAAAVTGTSLLFIRQVRVASYDTYLLALCTLALAAGLWALQPDQPERRRPYHGWGWLLAGVSLGAAVLAKGPLALLICGVPLLLLALGQPERRRLLPASLGVLGLAAVVALPWYAYILKTVPSAVELLKTEFEANRPRSAPPWYYLGLIGLVLPWCLWLPAGLASAFRRRADGAPAIRSALIWFAAIFILMSLHEAKQQRYIVPLLPAAGLLAAYAILHAAFRRPDTFARLARVHFGALVFLSVLYAFLGVGQGWLRRAELEVLPNWVYMLTAPLLILAAAQGWRLARRGPREAALWLTAGWMSLAGTPALFAYSHSYHGRYGHRAEVERVGALTRGQTLYHLTGPYTAPQYMRPDPKFLLYARRIAPGRDLRQLQHLAGPAWATAPVHPGADRDLQKFGWKPVLDYQDQGPMRRLSRKAD